MNLLAALPEWFTSWGWIVIVVAAVIIIAVVILLIVRAKKGGDESQVEEAPAAEGQSPAQPAAQPEVEEEEGIDEDTVDAEDAEEPEEDEAEESVQSSAANGASAQAAKEEKSKPANKTYHIAKRKADNRWQVKMAGGAKAIKLFNTQYEAIDFAKKLAENQEAKIVIHKEDGTFRRLTYHKTK